MTVVDRRGVLRGYELYLVEQWACSRQSPTLVIATYTGDPKHSIVVGVLGIPAEEKDWSPRLRVYFKAMQQFHARPKETTLGELMITNLSSFPSALTVIPVPGGDIREYKEVFIVNEDLKRMGCSGRSGMTLTEPTAATQAKFLQLYKTSDRIPFFGAVLELVKLCQLALYLFGKLDRDYTDGLLCDVTETAVGNWWTEIGSEHYNMEPTDGILGPTTVAALLGMLMGSRNRLNWCGAPITKDVFDVESTKKGIAYFQRSQKLPRTRRLDRQTLLRLHSVTAKAAAGEIWGVQKAVKSTVAEIGGKRGEIMIGMVGGRDKAGIGDVETLEMDRFIGLVHGEMAKWLWYGKPKRSTAEHHDRSLQDMGNILFGKEEVVASQPVRRTQSLPRDEEPEERWKEEAITPVYSAPPLPPATGAAESPGEKEALRKAVFKSVAGRVSDARSGFDRIRESIGAGKRGHMSRLSRDEAPETGLMNPSISSLAPSSAAVSSPTVNRAFTWKNKPEEYRDAFRKDKEADPVNGVTKIKSQPETPAKSWTTVSKAGEETQAAAHVEEPTPQQPPPGERRKDMAVAVGNVSAAGSVADENDLQGPFLMAEQAGDVPLLGLQRRHSISDPHFCTEQPLSEDWWPRRLSFSAAEEAVLERGELIGLQDKEATGEASRAQPYNAELARSLYASIVALKQDVEPWVLHNLGRLAAMNDEYGRQAAELQGLSYQLGEAFQRVKQHAQERVAGERAHVTEAVKDVEVLVARLEYEIGALVGRVQDAEDGVAQFEGQVEDVERRAGELKTQLETESWLHWAVRTLTGIGTEPNITQEPAR